MTETEQLRALKSVCRNLVDNLDQPTLLKDAGPAKSVIHMAIAQLTDVLRATETLPAPLQLYVWDDNTISYGAGLAFAIAASEEEERALVLEDTGNDTFFKPAHFQWEKPVTLPLDAPIGFGRCYTE